MQNHLALTFVGVVLAIALVAWLEPRSTGGTTFIVVVTLLATNAIGALGLRLTGHSKRGSR